MCPKVLEKPKRAPEEVQFSVKLDIIKHFDCGENKQVLCALILPVSTICTIYMHAESQNLESCLHYCWFF